MSASALNTPILTSLFDQLNATHQMLGVLQGEYQNEKGSEVEEDIVYEIDRCQMKASILDEVLSEVMHDISKDRNGN